jgi:TatD DNase family protein
MPWFDSHCHVSYEGVGVEAIAEARTGGVEGIVTVGTDAEQSRAAIDVARAHDGVWATVGLHPHDATAGTAGLIPLLGEPEVVAVGECGLDYHYDHSPRDVQRVAFAEQIRLAHERDLALVVHTREAWDDTFTILEDEGVPSRTVFHCFSGGPTEAERALTLGDGVHLSFSGIVTFKTADDVRAAAVSCPIGRLLVETDAPYLAPVPHRGQPNRPAWVAIVGTAIAAARRADRSEVEAATWTNAKRLFGLD